MTTAVNPFDHVLGELRIKPDDMPKMSTPSTPPSYQSVRDFQKALNHNAMSIHSYSYKIDHVLIQPRIIRNQSSSDLQPK